MIGGLKIAGQRRLLRDVVGKYWVIDDLRPARIHANMPPGHAAKAPFGDALRDEGNGRMSMAAWLLSAHLGES